MYKECQKSGWIKYEGRDFLELGVHQYRRPAVILKLTLEMEEARQAPLMALLFDLTLSFIDTIFSCFAKVYILGRTLAIYCFEGKSIVASGSINLRLFGKEWRLTHARLDVETGPSGTTFYVRCKGASEKYRDI